MVRICGCVEEYGCNLNFGVVGVVGWVVLWKEVLVLIVGCGCVGVVGCVVWFVWVLVCMVWVGLCM